VCTVCVDAHGETSTKCLDGPPASCQSTVDDAGLVCSTCEGQAGPPECLPAECSMINDCLRCVDPKGRVGVDCSVDYSTVFAASEGSIASGVFISSCTSTRGVPKMQGTTCHYPGPETCVVSEYGPSHCLSCLFPDGSGQLVCGDASEPLPDPLDGRPPGLPAPGSCTLQLGTDGAIACATCTRDDLSATTSCRDRAVDRCNGPPPRGAGITCVTE
jgi:hypothetical protein